MSVSIHKLEARSTSKRSIDQAIEIIGKGVVVSTKKRHIPGCGPVIYLYDVNKVSVGYITKGRLCMELLLKNK